MSELVVRIIIDRFSGRPNLSWAVRDAEAKQLIEEIVARRDVTADVTTGFLVAGVRGLIVEITPADEALRRGLHPVFRVGAPVSAADDRDIELSALLLKTGEGLGEDQIFDILNEMRELKKNLTVRDHYDLPLDLEVAATQALRDAIYPSPSVASVTDTSNCTFEIAQFNAVFWNGQPFWQLNNNCYNYGTNFRTNTFAQPGTGSNTSAAPSLAGVTAGALGDGLVRQGQCQSPNVAPRYTVALATTQAPDPFDYHWYRVVMFGTVTLWGHKLGPSPVTVVDNAGKLISSPQTCNRGIYKLWGGYFYVPNTVTIA